VDFIHDLFHFFMMSCLGEKSNTWSS